MPYEVKGPTLTPLHLYIFDRDTQISTPVEAWRVVGTKGEIDIKRLMSKEEAGELAAHLNGLSPEKAALEVWKLNSRFIQTF